MNRLRYTPLAQKDLQEIRAYIADELLNPTAAVNVVTKITKKIRSLVDFPLMGVALSSISDVETDYRFLVCGNYTVFYRFGKKDIYIIRILYSRRDFMKILFGNTAEENFELIE